MLNQTTNKILDGEITIIFNQITNKILDGEIMLNQIIISLMELLQMIIKDGEQVLLIMIINNNKIHGQVLHKINKKKLLHKIHGKVIKILLL